MTPAEFMELIFLGLALGFYLAWLEWVGFMDFADDISEAVRRKVESLFSEADE